MEKQGIRGWLPTVVSIIAILGFVGTLLTYSYTSGKKDQRIAQLEIIVVEIRMETNDIRSQLKVTNEGLVKNNSYLELLLDYFGIAKPKP